MPKTPRKMLATTSQAMLATVHDSTVEAAWWFLDSQADATEEGHSWTKRSLEAKGGLEALADLEADLTDRDCWKCEAAALKEAKKPDPTRAAARAGKRTTWLIVHARD